MVFRNLATRQIYWHLLEGCKKEFVLFALPYKLQLFYFRNLFVLLKSPCILAFGREIKTWEIYEFVEEERNCCCQNWWILRIHFAFFNDASLYSVSSESDLDPLKSHLVTYALLQTVHCSRRSCTGFWELEHLNFTWSFFVLFFKMQQYMTTKVK